MGTTEEPKGTPPQGQAPAGTKEPPKGTQSYTRAELDMAVHQALSQAGRDAHSLESRQAEIDRIARDLEQRQRAIDQIEMENLRDNPDALATYQAKKASQKAQNELAVERQKLANERAEHQERLARAEAQERKDMASGIAARYGVDAALLLKHCATPEAMEDLAQSLPKIKSPMKSDSGMTKGTETDWHDLTPDEKVRRGLKT